MNKPVCIESSDKMELLKEIKDRAFFNKLVEIGYERMVKAHVSIQWMIRPLLLMYKMKVISKYDLMNRLLVMGVEADDDLDLLVEQILESQEQDRTRYDKIPKNLEYQGYKTYAEWLSEGYVGCVAMFYFGYLPYGYDPETESYINISYYLTEKDFA